MASVARLLLIVLVYLSIAGEIAASVNAAFAVENHLQTERPKSGLRDAAAPYVGKWEAEIISSDGERNHETIMLSPVSKRYRINGHDDSGNAIVEWGLPDQNGEVPPYNECDGYWWLTKVGGRYRNRRMVIHVWGGNLNSGRICKTDMTVVSISSDKMTVAFRDWPFPIGGIVTYQRTGVFSKPAGQ